MKLEKFDDLKNAKYSLLEPKVHDEAIEVKKSLSAAQVGTVKGGTGWHSYELRGHKAFPSLAFLFRFPYKSKPLRMKDEIVVRHGKYIVIVFLIGKTI